MTSFPFSPKSAPIPIQGGSWQLSHEEYEPSFMPHIPIDEQRMLDEKLKLHEQVALCVNEIVEKIIFNLQQERQSEELDEELFFGELED